jgi:anti-sigma regulatory factor (Ser/Thr protein kinase)
VTTTATPHKPPSRNEAATYRLAAPNNAASPKVCRDLVAALLTATDHPGLVETARLLVSEVVTNVLVHTRVPTLLVEAVIAPGRVLVRVRDSDTTRRPLFPSELTPEQENGRGLLLIQRAADRWGVNWYGGSEPHSKAVWFELCESQEIGERRDD